MNIVLLEVRPHLIPFLYKEFEGIEYQYLKEKVKACKVDTKSSLGFIITTTLKKIDYPVKPTSKYYVYLSLSIDSCTGKIYKIEKNKDTFLMVPEKVRENINDVLEDQFRMAFQFHSRGMLKGNKSLSVNEVVSDFMQDYQMDDYGFELQSMLRLFCRGKLNKLSRIQNKTPHSLRSRIVSDK